MDEMRLSTLQRQIIRQTAEELIAEMERCEQSPLDSKDKIPEPASILLCALEQIQHECLLDGMRGIAGSVGRIARQALKNYLRAQKRKS
jgi:hypothetical protein